MSPLSVHELQPGTARFDAGCAWAVAHGDEALLFLADLASPLRQHAVFFGAFRGEQVCAVGVRFHALAPATFSCAAQDRESCAALIDAGVQSELVLVTHAQQVLPGHLQALPADVDTWLTGECQRTARAPEVGALVDAAELASFYALHGMRHFHPDMLRFGHYFGVRDDAGALLCAGGVQFVIAALGYAQVGGLVTAPHARGRALATRVLAGISGSLAADGVQHCGLFADAAAPHLTAFYAARGFRVRGSFAFRTLNRGAGR